jgi:uroporphyrinogen decarboxylase
VNSLERVLACLAGTPHDRPALLLNSGLLGARLLGAPPGGLYTDPVRYAEGQCAVRDTFGPDLLLSPFLFPAFGEAYGGISAQRGDHAPNLTRPAAASVEAALRLPEPDLDGHPRLLYLRGCIRELAARCHGETALVGVLPGPTDLPALMMGQDAWMDALLFDPDRARAVLDRCVGFVAAFANAMLADGAHIIACSGNFASPTIVPERVRLGLARPALEAAFGQIKGPIVLHHGGCRLVPHLGSYAGLPNVAAWVVDAGDSLAEARARLGPDPLLLGNLPGPELANLTPEAIAAQCRGILCDRAEDPHFILATSQADIPYDTPLEHVAAIAEAVNACPQEAP